MRLRADWLESEFYFFALLLEKKHQVFLHFLPVGVCLHPAVFAFMCHRKDVGTTGGSDACLLLFFDPFYTKGKLEEISDFCGHK